MISDVRDVFLPPSFFSKNREKLILRLPPSFLAVVFAGQAVIMSEDSEYRFFANRNFYYLAGIEQESSVLVISRKNDVLRTALFIEAADELKERWTGKRIRMETAKERSGLQDVFYLPALDDYLDEYLSDTMLPIALEQKVKRGPGKAFEKSIRSLYVERETVLLGPILAELRMVKEVCELDMIRKAIALTEEAIREMSPHIRPGVTELELYTSFEYALARRGCLVPAFPSIFAAGKNSLFLHHMNPTGCAKQGDLIQMDVGGRVAGLCADISRVFPADGVFSKRQLSVYSVVRACQMTAFSKIRPGCQISDINDMVKETARLELIALGVLAEAAPATEDVSSYYWHNVSHHVGHDVHDLCIRETKLAAGMVLTVEPGIYIPEWETGFRIEDMVLVTDQGCEVLTSSVPREWDEICTLTGSKGDVSLVE
jgi:Xaa-Pro aminopeptidase